MIIKKIILENYGLFAGRCEFDLAPRVKYGRTRPVVLFGGKNGAGKTTTLEAIRLLLYGRRSVGDRMSQRGYEDALLGRVHRNKNENTRAPYTKVAMAFDHVTYKVLTSGANPAAAFAQGIGGVAQATLIGGAGAATAAVTGGATAPAAVAAAALGAMAAGTESSARGGSFPSSTATAVGGMAGLYRGQFVRRQTEAMEGIAEADAKRAAAVENFTAQFDSYSRQNRRQQRSDFSQQPHHPDPNQAAIDIEAHAKS